MYLPSNSGLSLSSIFFLTVSKSKGLSQDEFNSGIKAFAENEVNALPNQEEEMKLLGENSKERVESADLWAKKNLSPDAYDAVAELASTAVGVKVIEEVVKSIYVFHNH